MKTNVLILGTLAGTLEVLSNCKLVLFLLCVLVFLRVVIFVHYIYPGPRILSRHSRHSEHE